MRSPTTLALLLLLLAAPAVQACGTATASRPPVPAAAEVEPVVLPAPHFPPAASGVPENVLRQVSARPNAITDTDAWFDRTGVRLPAYVLPDEANGADGDQPPGIPLEMRGLRLIQALRGDEATLLFYGPDGSGARLLVGWDPGSSRALYAYDFKNWEETPGWSSDFSASRLLWAEQKGRVLYVSHAHRTYAKETGGKNAYLAAIDLDRRELRWRSPALVANARNFLVQGDLIVSGYGFTAEPDYVYLVDAGTGAVQGRHKVKSGPEILALHEGRLHVRCYDTDYVFEPPASQPARGGP